MTSFLLIIKLICLFCQQINFSFGTRMLFNLISDEINKTNLAEMVNRF